MDKEDSKLTKVTEEGKEGIWKHILLHSSPEDLDVIGKVMYQSAQMRYEYAVLRYNARRLLQT